MKKVFITLAAAALASVGLAQTSIFNAMPSGQYFTGVNANNNEGGEYFGVSDASNSPITAFNLNFVTSGTGTEVFSDLQLMVTFFTSGNSTWVGSGAEFSGVGTSDVIDFGAQSLS